MPANASIAIELLLSNESQFQADLQRVAATIAEMFGGQIFQKFQEDSVKATEKVKNNAADALKTVKDAEKAGADATVAANKLKEESEARYAALKKEYTERGIDATRQQIHEEEQLIKTQRDALSNATIEGADKETKAILAAEVKQTNARLQGLRSVEKEITGARTFTEQLEKNVYGPVTAKATPGGVISNLLFGTGEYKAHMKTVEHEIEASEEKIAETTKAKEASKARATKAAEEERLGIITADARREIEVIENKVQQELHAEEQAAQKIAAIKKDELKQVEAKHEQSAEKSEGGIMSSITGSLGGFGGMAAAGGVAAAAGMLFEKGTEMKEREEEIAVGLRSMGMSAEEAEKQLKLVKTSSSEVSSELALNHVEVEKATAAYLKMGGTTDNLKEKQMDIAALSKKAGVDMEQAAKMYAKAGDPEVAGNLKKFGIVLDANMTTAERSAKIHEKLSGTLEGMKEAADGPLGSMQKMKDTVETLIETIGGLLFTILAPLFDILGAIAGIIKDYVIPPISFLANIVGTVLKAAFAVVIGYIKMWIAIWVQLGTWLLQAVEWIGKVTGITDFLVNAFHAVSDAVSKAIAWIKGAIDTIKNFGNSVLSMIGLTDKHSEAEEKEKKATDEAAEAMKKKKDAIDAATQASADYIDALKKQNDAEKKGLEDKVGMNLTGLKDIDDKLAGRKAMVAGETAESLRALREQYVAKTKELNKERDEQEEADKKRRIETGTEVDNDPKTKKPKVSHANKDAYKAAKAQAEEAAKADFATLEHELNTNKLTEEQYNEQKLVRDKALNEQLFAITKEYISKSKDAKQEASQFSLKAEGDDNQLRQLYAKKSIEDSQRDLDTHKQLIAGALKDNKIGKDDAHIEELKAERDFYTESLAAHQVYNLSTEADDKKLAAIKVAITDAEIANAKAAAKEIADIKARQNKAEDDDAIAGIKDAHQREVAQNEAKLSQDTESENKRYEEEKNKNVGHEDILFALKAEHEEKLISLEHSAHARKLDLETTYWTEKNSITKSGFQAINSQAEAGLGWLENRWYSSSTNQKTVLFGLTQQMVGSVKGMVTDLIKEYERKAVAFILGEQVEAEGKGLATAQKVTSDVVATTSDTAATAAHTANTAIVVGGETAKKTSWLSSAATAVGTAATTIGTWIATAAAAVANTAIIIGQNLLAAGSAMVSAVGSMISWLTSTLGPFALAAIPVAVAGLYGLFKGAEKVFNFADGGIVDRPQNFFFGKNGQHMGLRGEAGPEAIIPLRKLPSIIKDSMPGSYLPEVNAMHYAAMSSAGGHMDISPLVARLDKLSSHMESVKHAIKNTPPIVMDQYANVLSQRQAVVANDLTY